MLTVKGTGVRMKPHATTQMLSGDLTNLTVLTTARVYQTAEPHHTRRSSCERRGPAHGLQSAGIQILREATVCASEVNWASVSALVAVRSASASNRSSSHCTSVKERTGMTPREKLAASRRGGRGPGPHPDSAVDPCRSQAGRGNAAARGCERRRVRRPLPRAWGAGGGLTSSLADHALPGPMWNSSLHGQEEPRPRTPMTREVPRCNRIPTPQRPLLTSLRTHEGVWREVVAFVSAVAPANLQ